MKIPPRHLWLIAPLACLLVMAKGQRERYTVSFHLEASSEESSKLVFSHEVGQPPQTRYFRRVPEVTHRDFSAFHSFPAIDGNGFGVVLQLNDKGTRRLAMATASAQGSLLRVLVNGQGVDALFIDRPIDDGRLTIWGGVPAEVVKELEQNLPRLAGRAEVAEDPVPTGGEADGAAAGDREAGSPSPGQGRGYGEWPQEQFEPLPPPAGLPGADQWPELPR